MSAARLFPAETRGACSTEYKRAAVVVAAAMAAQLLRAALGAMLAFKDGASFIG